MKKLNKNIKKLSDFLLYGLVFSSLAFISSIFAGKEYTLDLPIASADVPASPSNEGGIAFDGDGDGDGGDSCDGSDGADSCDSF